MPKASSSYQGGYPFLSLPPLAVVVLGLAVAVAIGALGMRNLEAQQFTASALRAETLTRGLATRLSATSDGHWEAILTRASERSGADWLVAGPQGEAIFDNTGTPLTTVGVVQLIQIKSGKTTSDTNSAHFFATPIGTGGRYLIGFVALVAHPAASASLLNTLSAFTLLLVMAGTIVALSFVLDVRGEIHSVSERIESMARHDIAPGGEPIVVRATDQVGVLTKEFNELVERFRAAEAAYRQDLSGALDYDRDRTAFLAALSHELRTPLNAILGFTDILLSGADGPLSDDAHENLTIVRRSGGHLKRLIDDILDLSALESGQLHLKTEEIDLYEIAQEVLDEARVGAADKSLRITLSGTSASAWADPLRVRQILTNLVSNAVKFTARGSVELAVTEEPTGACFRIVDTGPGIARHEQAAIFEEYRQTGDRDANVKGTGLGLAITRRLVRMNRGTISLKSEIGVGTEFWVELPREPSSEQVDQSFPKSRPLNAVPERER